jgi:hypothetical protein
MCVNGTCAAATYGGVGAACDPHHAVNCDRSLACVDFKCRAPVLDGQACTQDEECLVGGVCVTGVCVTSEVPSCK